MMLQHMMSTPMELRPKLVQLYWREMQRGQWRRFFACLLRRDCRLELLRRHAESHAEATRAYVGLKEVPLDAICGTEEQAPAFDRGFHPIGERPRQRWLSIAEARLQGKPMPPVQLTEKNGCYYVRDGHHRISVAHALGEAFIEAEVVRIQMGSTR
jgi:S-adenosylmethionine:diacylglycerol 3-amino-3-carboxypropyl transferase